MSPAPEGLNEYLAPLSEPQLETYLSFVSAGTLTTSLIRKALSLPSGSINVLKTLIRLHTSKISWGSVAGNYTTLSINSLKASDVFAKLVGRNLGGHCLEIVPLFAAVLRALGFDLYLTGARISTQMTGEAFAEGPARKGLGFHGWSHCIMIVTISAQKYVVDPQYLLITEPVLLDPEGPIIQFDSIPRAMVRLRYTSLSEVYPNRASNSGLKTWLFEYKMKPEEPDWKHSYVFDTQTEWFLEDLTIMNVWLARAEDSYLVTQLIALKPLLAEDSPFLSGPKGPGQEGEGDPAAVVREDGSIIEPAMSGDVSLVADRLKVWRYGHLELDRTLKSEKERVDVLREWFGIELNQEEQDGIMTRPTVLKGMAT